MFPRNKAPGLPRPSGRLSAVVLLLIAAACAPAPEAPPDDGDLVLSPAAFQDLPGWAGDDVAAVLPALRRSCPRLVRGDDARPIGPSARFGTVADWRPICEAVEALDGGDADTVRALFEQSFKVWAAGDGNPENDLFTGYFEPELRGSRTPDTTFDVAIYPRPDDLILVNLGDFRESMKGERIAGRLRDGRLRPYDSRADIEAGSLDRKVEPLIWLDDPIDAFFLHIQGSGLVRLTDGTLTRVGYDGHNGHIYFAIGRYLVQENHVPREEMSMQAIRSWLTENPDRMSDVMNRNPSYIFFRELRGNGPIGAQGVALTAGRSLAVDRTDHALGVPVYVDLDYADADGNRLQRLMIAQDTGGAIRGPIRGDFFWGSGDAAGDRAGAMAAGGRMWLLLPHSVDPNALVVASQD